MTAPSPAAPEPTPPAATAKGGPDDTAFLHAVGERVRTARARRGMTRRLLSRHSRVSERYIAQLESGSGNVSILILRAIADALAVPMTDLIEDRAERARDVVLLEGAFARMSAAQRAEARTLLLDRFADLAADHRRDRIALIGLRGAGKSSLGRLLAARRGVAFHEIDREIEREAGLELREIFELHGQAGFRRLERGMLDRVLAGAAAAVIEAGGSVVAEAATFERLLHGCRVVWVRASPEEHMARVVAQGDLRPMQDNRRAMDDLRAILASRAALYAKADLTLDTSGRTLAESLEDLATLLG